MPLFIINMLQDSILLISEKDLNEDTLKKYIYSNLNTNYYLSNDFSNNFYRKLAICGFITTSIYIKNTFYLLPEIQFEYALLDFNNLHISKKVRKLLNKNRYKFLINNDLNKVLKNIRRYHKDSWITDEYEKLIYNLYKENSESFSIFSVELYDSLTNELIAGEIGYKIKNTYTSLSGFSSKEKKYRDFGKLQMTLLAFYLKENNFLFWNLGHPYMEYKFALGATLYNRDNFLKKWLKAVN